MELQRDEKAEAVKEVAERLLVRLAERLEKKLANDSKLETTVKIELVLDWPYEIIVELSANSSIYSARDVERALAEVLEDELKQAEEALKARGLRLMP